MVSTHDRCSVAANYEGLFSRVPALEVWLLTPLLLSPPVDQSARETPACLHHRFKDGKEIFRRQFQCKVRRNVELPDHAHAGGKGIGGWIEAEQRGRNAIRVAGEVAVRPAAHRAASDGKLWLQVEAIHRTADHVVLANGRPGELALAVRVHTHEGCSVVAAADESKAQPLVRKSGQAGLPCIVGEPL